MTTSHPCQLHLPGGIRADLIPGTRPPRYAVAGEPIALDVAIPDDLARAGWCWLGSYVYRAGVGYATAEYGVVGAFAHARATTAPRVVQLRLFLEAA